MFPGLHWLFRMKRWQQRPPSLAKVLLVLGVVAFCVALVAIETVFGWPDWMTVERAPVRRMF